MSYSFGEVEATSKKAARAVGYPWGIAEEAASSVKWLCRYGIDGCDVLARYLEKIDGHDPLASGPVIKAGDWTTSKGSLCPLLCGIAISDRASSLLDTSIRLQKVEEPTLLLFFVSQVVRIHRLAGHDSSVACVEWNSCRCTTDGRQLSIVGTVGPFSDEVVIGTTDTLEAPRTLCERATPVTSAWQTLNQFAHRTYVPATEESRLKGAGAGLSDND